jgi:hypothetical protein
MHSLEVCPLGRPRFQRSHRIAEIGSPHAFEHGIETLGALGMAWSSEMFEVHRMSGEQHGHAVGRYLPATGSELPFHS